MIFFSPKEYIPNHLEPQVVLVWIGHSLPLYATQSLQYFFSVNKITVHLLIDYYANIRALNSISPLLCIHKIEFQETDFYKPNGMLDHPLIIKATQRLIVLRDFAISRNIDKFFHFEFDNLVADLDHLSEKLDSYGNGLFVVRDTYERALASFLYCNHLEPLLEFEYYLNDNSSNLTEMHVLGNMCKCRSDVYSLPTESYVQNSKLWHIVPPDLVDGVFDACAIGTYLFGVDPSLLKFRPIKNKVKHPNSSADWPHIRFFCKDNALYIQGCSDRPLKVYNIHVHSKLLELAIHTIRFPRNIVIFCLNRNIPLTLSYKYSIRYIFDKISALLRSATIHLSSQTLEVIRRFLDNQ